MTKELCQLKELKKSEKEVHYKEYREPTDYYRMEGRVIIDLWGGDKGSVLMDPAYFQAKDLTKAVIYANLNDGQFGSSAIISAEVTLEQMVRVTRVYANEDGVFFGDNTTKTDEFEQIVSNLPISRVNDFDEKVGHPKRGINQ